MKKRILYTLCFIALLFLDFIRNTQNGDIWSVAVNATGPVMLVIIGSAWPVKEMMTKGKLAWTFACIGVLGYSLYRVQVTGMDVFMGVYIFAFLPAVFNVWWLAIFWWEFGKAFFHKKRKFFFPGVCGSLWIVMTILMTVSKSERLWPVWFLAMFSLFYLTEYREADQKALTDGLVDGTIIGFLLLQGFAYGFRPYDEVRYMGAYANSNMTALHYVIVYSAVLAKLHFLQAGGGSKRQKRICFALACVLPGFLLMTMGRTAWGVAVLLTLFYGIWVMRVLQKRLWRQILLRGAALGIGALLAFPVVFASVRWLPTVLHRPVWFLSEYSVDKVHSCDPADSWKYVDLDEFLEALFGRIGGTFGYVPGTEARARTFHSPFVLVVQAASPQDADGGLSLAGPEGMDESLNIRRSIYKAYLRDLNLSGHGPAEGMYGFSDLSYHAWHAQNLWLEAAYRFGIPAGVLFLVLTVVILAADVKRLKKYQHAAEVVIPLMVSLIFFGYGVMESVWNPGQYILVIFFITRHPLFHEG